MPNNLVSEKPGELGKLIQVAYLVVILSVFAWAKEFLLPLILAILISFLLAPVVSRLERWRFPRAVAVLSVVAIVFALIGGLCSTLSLQGLDLVNSLPKYRDNIHARWAAIQRGPPGPLNLALSNVDALITDLGKVTASGGVQQPEATKVQIVSGADNVLAIVKNSLTPVAAPIGEFAVIVVLVVFMLLERKRLRVRFLRLIGHSRVATTNLAVDEVGSKLSRFLLGQLLVNTGYALLLGLGLSLIGIPNALLWAVLTLVLRFLPYVGLWISAFFPLLLSIAISTSWKEPILTLALYGSLEVFTNNFVEPFVLGGSTGMSPLAIIVSALFWTWLWGPIGLLLATPLTACLVVLGRYFPAFNICSVLLAAEPPSSSETKFILLLTENRLPEAKALLQELGGMQLSVGIAEELILPTLRAIENDLYPGATDPTKSRIYAQLRELIEEMTVERSTELEQPPEQTEQPGLAIVPFMGEGDEIVGRVIARLLAAKGIGTDLLSWRTLRAEKVERLKELKTPWILLSAIESRSVITVGRMAHSIKLEVPDALILVGLWSLPTEGAARWVRRIKESSGSALYTNINQAVRGIVSLVPQVGDELPVSAEK
ncbi:MAG TPA: AI-2E family transporter [Chthoniobacterales bacterium]|jgi:predicted PurR-regulated permease PerM|nr:AI-2E family transporter [Chthoniobacterales bacterium]